MTDQPEPRKRTAKEIEEDLRRTREELTRNVDQLSEKIDPRRQMASFVDDVKTGDSKAVGLVGGIAAAVAGVVGLVILRKSR